MPEPTKVVVQLTLSNEGEALVVCEAIGMIAALRKRDEHELNAAIDRINRAGVQGVVTDATIGSLLKQTVVIALTYIEARQSGMVR